MNLFAGQAHCPPVNEPYRTTPELTTVGCHAGQRSLQVATGGGGSSRGGGEWDPHHHALLNGLTHALAAHGVGHECAGEHPAGGQEYQVEEHMNLRQMYVHLHQGSEQTTLGCIPYRN
jgi:hypothetical protein